MCKTKTKKFRTHSKHYKRKLISCFVYKYNNGLISWRCKKQNYVALLSAEAEIIAISEVCQEAI